MAIPVFIDTDPGLDDALALMVAMASSELDIRGIISVSGNQSIEKTTANAAKLLDLAGSDIPLIQGGAQPILREKLYAAEIHGESGLGTVVLPDSKRSRLYDPARVIYEEALKQNGKLEIIALGPLTNIAQALLVFPELRQHLARIVLMGGGHAHGNVTPSAEFNIYADPEAAKIVFESGIPVAMLGLDATHQVYVDRQDVQQMIPGENKKSEILRQLLLDMIDASEGFFGLPRAHLHDLLAVIYTYNESVTRGDHYHVDIETRGEITYGKTVVDVYRVTGKEKNAYVAFHADRDKVLAIIREKLQAYA